MPNPTDRPRFSTTTWGVTIGLLGGVVLGLLTGSLLLWIALGAALGVAVGAGLERRSAPTRRTPGSVSGGAADRSSSDR